MRRCGGEERREEEKRGAQTLNLVLFSAEEAPKPPAARTYTPSST